MLDVLVDFACDNVTLAREGDVEVAFVVAKVEVDFTAIVEHKDFSVCGVLARPRLQRLEIPTWWEP